MNKIIPVIHVCDCESCKQNRALQAINRAMKLADDFYEYEVVRQRWLDSKVIPFPMWRTRAKGEL